MKMFSQLKKAAYEFALAASLVCLGVSSSFAKTHADTATFLTSLSVSKNFVLKSSVATPVAIQLAQPSSHAKHLAETFSRTLINGTRFDKHGKPKPMNKSDRDCVAHTRNAYRAVGIDIGHGYAKDFIQSLPHKGFKIIPLDNYKEQEGDLVAILPHEKHKEGHIGAFAKYPKKKHHKKRHISNHEHPTGLWVSDFGQRDIWPYREKRDDSLITILRPKLFEDARKESNERRWRFANESYLISNEPSDWGLYFNSPHVGNFLGFRQEKAFIIAMATKNPTSPVREPDIIDLLQIRPKAHYERKPLLVSTHTPQRTKKHQNCEMEGIEGLAASLAAISSRRARVKSSPDDDLKTLHDQWHAARKAVLMRNKALRKGSIDRYAEKKLRNSVKAMHVCLPSTMKSDIVTAYQAARYAFNQMSDTSLFSARRYGKDQRAILSLMAMHIGTLAVHDHKLSAQMARFVVKNTRNKKLRTQVLCYTSKQTPSPA